jgi:hypothetical protein
LILLSRNTTVLCVNCLDEKENHTLLGKFVSPWNCVVLTDQYFLLFSKNKYDPVKESN